MTSDPFTDFLQEDATALFSDLRRAVGSTVDETCEQGCLAALEVLSTQWRVLRQAMQAGELEC